MIKIIEYFINTAISNIFAFILRFIKFSQQLGVIEI